MSELLKFQIQHITSHRLQREMFAALAPALTIGWETLPDNDRQRAECLSDALKEFSNQNKLQHDDLCAALGVVSVIGRDSKNTSFLEKEIKNEGLWEAYWPDDFGMPSRPGRSVHAHTTNNIAAWICVLAKQATADEARRKRQASAKRIWGRLSQMSVALSAESASYVFFLSDSTRSDMTTRQRAEAFCAAYKKYRTEVTGIKNYPAVADDSVHFEFERYSVNMAPNPHLSVQLEGSDFDSKIDPNADSFRIDYFAERGYLRITRVEDKATSQRIAAIFAESALGAKVEDTKGKRYMLDAFASRSVLKTIGEALPEANREARDEVWVSALRCRYLDSAGGVLSKNHEYDFPYDPARDIYGNLELGYPLAANNAASSGLVDLKHGVFAARRELLEVEISFRFHERVPMGGGQHGFSKHFLPVIKIHATPKTCDFKKKTRDLDAIYREVIHDVLAKCDLSPKSRDQIVLGDA